MPEPWAVILAAGEGKRMKSALPKVLHSLCGREIVRHVLENIKPITKQQVIVIGQGAEQVKAALGDKYTYVYQQEQKGTGDALWQALAALPEVGQVLVVCGDTPFLSSTTLKTMLEAHTGHAATVLTAVVENPAGYGRILRDQDGCLKAIVEEQEASASQKLIAEINAGAYVFQLKVLKRYLPFLANDNKQGEYYLTDLIAVLAADRQPVNAYKVKESQEVFGINDRCQLAKAAKKMRASLNERFMKAGVTLLDPETTYLDVGVMIGPDTVIYPQTVIEGETTIGEGCVIGPGCFLQNVKVGERALIRQSVIIQGVIGPGAVIGPFAYIRPDSIIGQDVKIGSFVEVKKSLIGKETKIPHLSYVGDALIDDGVNLGAGTIIVNYDGQQKHCTAIKKKAFIGCNSNLVAPVTIGEESYIGAGSTITKDVPAGALALGRARQVNKIGLAKKLLRGKNKD